MPQLGAAGGGGATIFEPLDIGFFGLSRWDEMLLRSMIRTIAGQTQHRWRVGGDRPCSLVFCPPNTKVPAGALAQRGVSVVYAAQAPDPQPLFWLAAPPRLNALLQMLDGIGEHLQLLRAADATPVVDGFFETMERLFNAGVGAHTLLVDGMPLAYVDIDRRVWRPLMASAALIEKLPARISAERIAASMPASDMESSIHQLLTMAAENMTHVPLLSAIDPLRPVLLTAWVEIVPDSPLAPLIPTAAALLRTPMTVTEMRARPRIPVERLSAWLNASWLMGRLQYAELPVAVARGAVATATGAGERGGEKLRGFVNRLRLRLGLIGTPE